MSAKEIIDRHDAAFPNGFISLEPEEWQVLKDAILAHSLAEISQMPNSQLNNNDYYTITIIKWLSEHNLADKITCGDISTLVERLLMA